MIGELLLVDLARNRALVDLIGELLLVDLARNRIPADLTGELLPADLTGGLQMVSHQRTVMIGKQNESNGKQIAER